MVIMGHPMTYSEIAQIEGLRPSQVKGIVRNALRKIRITHPNALREMRSQAAELNAPYRFVR